jgi:hypothetical protein
MTDPNTFAIGIQQGRSMVIKGLSIEGPFNPGGGINDAYYKRPFANWASAYGIRDHLIAHLRQFTLTLSAIPHRKCLLMEVIRV